MNFLPRALQILPKCTAKLTTTCNMTTKTSPQEKVAAEELSPPQQKEEEPHVKSCPGIKTSKPYSKATIFAVLTLGGITAGYALYEYKDRLKIEPEKLPVWHLMLRRNFPTYSLDEVKKHNSIDKGVWVTFGVGVYDITDYVKLHPGGDAILMSAGTNVEEFWKTLTNHYDRDVYLELERYRIGNLSAKEAHYGVSKEIETMWYSDN